MRTCALIPTYNHYAALPGLVTALMAHVDGVVVVDDGSAQPTRDALEQLRREYGVEIVRREMNGGKGAAVKDGLLRARELGYSHALQVDADGQHDLGAAPRMLEASRTEPTAAVMGAPEFDDSAPKGRLHARRICQFWVNVETGGQKISDPMCGFRVYPIEAALATRTAGDRMEFDPEIAVRLVWAGAPVVNVPVLVRYPEGGTSNFRLLEDNLRISWMHSKLMTRLVLRWIFGRWMR